MKFYPIHYDGYTALYVITAKRNGRKGIGFARYGPEKYMKRGWQRWKGYAELHLSRRVTLVFQW